MASGKHLKKNLSTLSFNLSFRMDGDEENRITQGL